MGFWNDLERSIDEKQSLLCVGIDPVAERIPERFETVGAFCHHIVNETAPFAAAFKPNIAFFEALGLEGLVALKELIDYIPTGIPVVLDAKRNDIGSTAQAYADAIFGQWGVGATTITPYLGGDGVRPFIDNASGGGVFILCHTSNPSGPEIQDWAQAGRPLYQRVADLAAQWAGDKPIGLVMGAPFASEMAAIRRDMPSAWFLVPGVGAQGGDVEQVVSAGLRDDGKGMIINASRSIIYADSPSAAARDLRDTINLAIVTAKAQPKQTDSFDVGRLARALFEGGCVRFGLFTLKSGAESPIYVDLRRLVSTPSLLQMAASMYASLLSDIDYDRIAAIPYAALPIGTAVSLLVDRPLIYPRKEAKSYGTKRQIEGHYASGERIVLLDDLISSGGSKIEALQPLEEEGLAIEDVVVLIDREQGGSEELAEKGYQLHAACTLKEIVLSLAAQGLVDQITAGTVMSYLMGTLPGHGA